MARTSRGVRTLTALATAAVLTLTGAVPASASVGVPRPARAGHLTCEGPVLGCVRDARRALEAVRDELRCDHRAPFAAIYAHLQRSLERAVASGAPFEEPSWLAGRLNTGFLNLYVDAYEADRAGRPVPPAWRAAFDAARTADVNAGQDVLLGANAHIQRDLPHVIAALGLTRPDGGPRKADYDRFQRILDDAYGPAVRDVARRYDPLVSLADDRWNPLAGHTAGQLFRMWREQAWEHARQLAGATGPQARDRVVRRIEANAARWARLLATVRVPGYRAVRDAYCRTRAARPTVLPAADAAPAHRT
ncbi:DUF5995 family protein [Streptomyces sp. enrichment culture]|uniref:DUF5995 family protein n=1 Tax=Streptomyces sp. enrichment culture TaxID=1795815 RepID=UPI003F550198